MEVGQEQGVMRRSEQLCKWKKNWFLLCSMEKESDNKGGGGENNYDRVRGWASKWDANHRP